MTAAAHITRADEWPESASAWGLLRRWEAEEPGVPQIWPAPAECVTGCGRPAEHAGAHHPVALLSDRPRFGLKEVTS